ncbi:MAG: hypothetical protein V4564_09245 [Pseudomonadota bacterium]
MAAMLLLVTAMSLAVQAESSTPSLAERAVAAFVSTCLAHRGEGVDAVTRSIQSQPNVTEMTSLPALANVGKPMRMFGGGEIEYLVRLDRNSSFGCFVAFKSPDHDNTEAMVIALSAQPGMSLLPAKKSKKLAFDWSITGSKDSVRLVPQSQLGGVLINLEVEKK